MAEIAVIPVFPVNTGSTIMVERQQSMSSGPPAFRGTTVRWRAFPRTPQKWFT